MTDMHFRDLSRIPESQLTPDERVELKRRFEEFVGRLRKKGGLSAETGDEPEPKRIQAWNPRDMAQRH